MKDKLNKILRHFNAEIHGLGYLQALAKGEFSKDVFKIQRDLMQDKNVSVIFDLGANRGDVTIKYATEFPEAVIHAFEPFPVSYNILKEKFETNRSVVCNQIGLADKESEMPFYVNKSLDTNSLLKPQKMGLSSDVQVENQSIITIPCTTIDAYCESHNISRIDILKIDIQGGEYNALKGAKSLLEEKKIGLLYLESYFREQYEQQPLFHDISKLLHGFGYYLQDIYNPFYGKKSIAWCDVIFLPWD